MNYDLQTFASIPLNMEALAVQAWVARHAGGKAEPKSDWLDDYLESETEDLRVSFDKATGIAEFSVCGVMWKGASLIQEVCCGLYNTDRIQENIQQIAGMEDVTGVVINIDTPGGMARGVFEAASAVAAYRKASGIQVAAWIPDCGCSAGYYVASACDVIAAHPAAMVGSIGTMAVAVDSSEMYKKLGLDVTLYTGGAKLKGMGTDGVAWTKEWHAKLRGTVDQYRAEFVGFVQANRPEMGDDCFNGDAFEARKAPRGMVNVIQGI